MALGSIQGSLDDGEADTGDGDRPDVLGGEHEVQQAEDQRGVVGAQRRNAPRTAASGSPGGVFHDQEGFTTRGSSKVFGLWPKSRDGYFAWSGEQDAVAEEF